MHLGWPNLPTQDPHQARIVARVFYNRIGAVACPVLNGELIAFNAVGFDHICRKPHRTSTEILERLLLLPYAVEILNDPSAVFTCRVQQETVRRRGRGKPRPTEVQY